MKKTLSYILAGLAMALTFTPAFAETSSAGGMTDVPPAATGSMRLPSDPTSAGGMTGSTSAAPHGKVVRDAKAQYAQDKQTCRENTMSPQEYRDCRKAAKMERNERIEDSPAQTPVAP